MNKLNTLSNGSPAVSDAGRFTGLSKFNSANSLIIKIMILTVLFPLWGLWGFSAYAADGTFGGGDGSPTDPYIIEDAADLDAVRSKLSSHYRLANDIDLTAYLAPGGAGCEKWGAAGWYPIGDNSTADINSRFSGSLNGAGYKITGLWINRASMDRVGLFGYITAGKIDSLGVIGESITGKDYVGCLLGSCHALNSVPSTITNCYATGNVESTGNAGYVGGLAGGGYLSIFTNCYATGNVTGRCYIGGLVGSSTSIIKNCYATGNVTTIGQNSTSRAGGLVGNNSGSTTSSAEIDQCYATGNVSAYGTYVGGLVGSTSYGIITNSYATGNVRISIGEGAGGLVGIIAANPSTIKYCYASGSVRGGNSDYQSTGIVGGLIGKDDNSNYSYSTILNCIAANDSVFGREGSDQTNRIIGWCRITPNTTNASNLFARSNMVVIVNGNPVSKSDDRYLNGTSKPLNTLQSLEFYTNSGNWNTNAWDMTTVWNICDGDGLPCLRWQKNISCEFVTVGDIIINISLTATAGEPLTLTATIEPSNATNKTIVWSVKDAGSTGATIDNGINPIVLNTTGAGTAVITASIADGLAEGKPYTKDFSITVTATGIAATAATEAKVTGYYSIMGQRLPQAPEKGFYIIMYDNGKAEKVIKM